MNRNIITYDEPLFRPPAEANSLIVQATLGCSWNKCHFCMMYKSKTFSINSIEKIEQFLQIYSQYDNQIKKIFIADGNAFVLSFERLKNII